MIDIPVIFEYNGSIYQGFLTEFGTGWNVWSLSVKENRDDKEGTYHCGQLLYYPHNDIWMFYNYYDTMKDLSDYFGSVIVNWYQ